MSNSSNEIAHKKRHALVFRCVMYFNIAIMLLLFFTLGLSWIQDRDYNHGAGGEVMVFIYIAPIFLLDMIATVYYIVIYMMLNRREAVAREYYKCKVAYRAHILLSVIAIVLLWV